MLSFDEAKRKADAVAKLVQRALWEDGYVGIECGGDANLTSNARTVATVTYRFNGQRHSVGSNTDDWDTIADDVIAARRVETFKGVLERHRSASP